MKYFSCNKYAEDNILMKLFGHWLFISTISFYLVSADVGKGVRQICDGLPFFLKGNI